MTRSRKLLFFGGGVGIVALLAVVGFFTYRWWVIRTVKREAAALGVIIDSVDAFHLTRDAIELDGVSFSFEGVPGSSGTAKVVQSGLDRPPKKVSLDGVEITFAGRAAVWVTAMSKWSRAHADVFELAIAATNARVTAHEEEGDAAWLSLSGATLSTRARDLRIDAKEAEIIGMRASPLVLTWAADGSHASIAVGGDGAARAFLHADVRPTTDGAQIDVDVAPTPIADLATRLHLDIGSHAKVTAHAALTVHGSGSFEGNATAAVDGWIPAHPKELNGILFGDKTRASVTFKAGDDRANVALDPLRVQAGALDLKGAGTITRGGKRLGKLKVDLQGSLPCSQVARSAGGEMGGIAGAVVGLLGDHAVEGNVAIHVRAQGDLADLKNVQITHDEKSGCSLGF
jgi:ADP-dependent NAD(P)H-hydrate dehydratase / NAD(P)H-hydrate epimerase